jgi:hypothetical protein
MSTKNNKKRSADKESHNMLSAKKIKRSADDEEPIIYYAIICHGIYNIIENTPIYLKVPPKIRNFNKITYAPFGLMNIVVEHYDDLHIVETLTKNLSISQPYGEDLLEELKKMKLLKTPAEFLDKTEKGEDRWREARSVLHLLNRNPLYEGFIYGDHNKKIPIIDKKYETDDKDPYLNIYVVFQKGGELKVGDAILKNITEKSAISTQKLLELSEANGYKTVVVIDYSCESCHDFENNIPTRRDRVMTFRELVRNKTIGRGGKKKMIKRKRTKRRRVSLI